MIEDMFSSVMSGFSKGFLILLFSHTLLFFLCVHVHTCDIACGCISLWVSEVNRECRSSGAIRLCF